MGATPEDMAKADELRNATKSSSGSDNTASNMTSDNEEVAKNASKAAAKADPESNYSEKDRVLKGPRRLLKMLHNAPGELAKDKWWKTAFINSWNDENEKILKDLQGKNGPGPQKKAEDVLERARSELKAAKNTPGASSWLDVCDPMFKVLIAYMAYRKAAGRPDSIAGRCYDLLFKPLLIPFDYAEKVCKTLDRAMDKYDEQYAKNKLPEDDQDNTHQAKPGETGSLSGKDVTSKSEQTEHDTGDDYTSTSSNGPGR